MTVTPVRKSHDVLSYIQSSSSPIKCVLPYIPMNMDPASRDIPFRGKLLVTYCLMASWVGFFAALMCLSEWKFVSLRTNWMIGPSAKMLTLGGGMTRYTVLGQHQYWRLISCEFSHAGLLHLMMNAVSVYFAGEILEPDWGSLKFGLVFLVSAFSASVFSLRWSHPQTVSVGASGGAFGVMSSVLVYIVEHWYSVPRAKTVLTASVAIVAVSIALSFVPSVDWRAHVGGALGGMLAASALVSDLPLIPGSKSTPPMPPQTPQKRPPVARMEGSHSGEESILRIYKLAPVEELLLSTGKEQKYALVCDMPYMTRPSIVQPFNPSATRLSLIRDGRGLQALGWKPVKHSWNWTSPWLWALRISSILLLVGLCTFLMFQAQQQFDTNFNNASAAGRRLSRSLIQFDPPSLAATSGS